MVSPQQAILVLGRFERLLLAMAAKPRRSAEPPPLLIELLEPRGADGPAYEAYPFAYFVQSSRGRPMYSIAHSISDQEVAALRGVVSRTSEGLDPADVIPLTFVRLIGVLSQAAATSLGGFMSGGHTKALAELCAYEAVGLSRILALAKDEHVTEFYTDSDASPLYLDHSVSGRLETSISLTERERAALQTHSDTFSGYSLDFRNPSIKNDFDVSGAKLRVSIDLEPISVNRFALDVRRLNLTSMSLDRLVEMGAIGADSAAILVAWLEAGGNVTIIGETGTGKTTLLNALDEMVNPRLRRVYIEDAVETRDLLALGYHQLKLKVDPFDRSGARERTKELEIVKVLHRSPDIVVLSEIQSEEHSRAFFHSLSAGARGMQTFHATTVEQALRRWTTAHHVSQESLLDLGLLVQMSRPDRLGSRRMVHRICQLVQQQGTLRVRDAFVRDREGSLRKISEVSVPDLGIESAWSRFQDRAREVERSLVPARPLAQ
ncbi:MAG: type II/IV secretion system ATPase subunit [archaeon]|nr:MAG: type II/IV secretion system ATPase subunit [archaeon]